MVRAEMNAYVRRANHVAIRHAMGRVVAIIEIVSPGNKDSRNAIRAFVDSAELLRPDQPGSMNIDATTRSPERAAHRILEHIRNSQ